MSQRSRPWVAGDPTATGLGASVFGGAAAESSCEADQSVPTQRRSDGTGTVLGNGIGIPGIDGMVSDGGLIRFDRPVAASGVNGLGGPGTLTFTAPDVPGTGGVPGGVRPMTEDAEFCTVLAIPGGVSRSVSVTVLPGVPGVGDPGVPVVTLVPFGGVGGTGGAG